MKKVLVVLLLLSVIAFGVFANGSSETKTETEEVTIRFYNYALSEAAKKSWWEGIISDFEAENPNIKIECVSVDFNSMIQTLNNDIASGLSVDMILGENSWVVDLASAGFLSKPEDVLSEEFYSGYNKEVLNALTYDGAVYAVPHYFSPWIIYVNKDLVEGAGLSMDDFPTTYEGLKSWIEKLSDVYQDITSNSYNSNIKTIFGLTTAEVPATGLCLKSMLAAFGGDMITEDEELADFTSGKNATAIEELLDFDKWLISNGYDVSNQKLKDYRAAFGAGNVVMYVDQAWGYAQISGVAGEEGKAFTVSATLPTKLGTYGEGKTILSAHVFLYGANLTDAKKDAIDKFTQYVTDAKQLEGYLNDIGVAFPAHEITESVTLPSMLDGAKEGMNNLTTQPNPVGVASAQTKLATMLLNYCVNGMSRSDSISQFVKDAEFILNN